MSTPGRGGALAPGTAGYRALKVAVVVMGVAIIAGTALLGVLISRRLSSPGTAAASGTLVLDEPAGTRIVGIAPAGERLAVQVSGGGADRVLLVDPARLMVTGRIEAP